MIFFFYIILAALTKGFAELVLPGWISQHILLIPIFLGYLGICWGLYNLTYDPLVKWGNVKKSAIFIISGTAMFFTSIIFQIITEIFKENAIAVYVISIIGTVFLILSSPLFSVGFLILRKDLKDYYFKKYMSKYPNLFLIISYLVQSLGCVFLLVGGLISNVTSETIVSIILYSGIAFVVISILGLGIGFYPLFISFRTYPKIMETIEETQKNKTQSTTKKTKKAS